MRESRKLLVASDEPMVLVDMLYEFEGRGFSVVPRIRDDCAKGTIPNGIDAAVLDFRHADDLYLTFVSDLGRSGIPVVVFGGRTSTTPPTISGLATYVAKPVDYDDLTGRLHGLIDPLSAIATHAGGGAASFSQGVAAERP